MRSAALAAVAVAVAAFAMIGCGSQNPGQPAGSASGTPESTAPPAKPASMNEYLHSVGVTVTPVSPESPANVRVDVPLPRGWENLGALDPAYLIADKPSDADQGRTPSAVVYLIKLGGPLDARKVISEHGFADAQNTQNFQKIASSLDDFQGYPSAAIEGTYENQGVRVHAWNRDVIVPDGPLHYLVQFTVTTTEAQSAALSQDVAALTGGLKITKH
ncbi:LpqN/LpqT family lipoprotein [Mycobacteroides abscessus]|uniref:LpqN/LpqT family lipoprotein n=1 Tax=Mycobacteroides abscessus TaxID=36809 RepID=UPI0009A6A0A5|nr:LpqN/LpqT family lipoprotein [Mycobacteroides abscessus]SKF72563.1 putative lipoprotein LpqT [Mycobacteroides abscessus subsp. bolletii]SKG76160.1 putative lipoprotein LpqT [Mycobacteroides abscessus subsp. bolletii]SKH37711.1 putative lipoprotein LpqT [Mycobacteroides abscessus subsp. bolletii]SKH83646.1 putative lipoprotein LpqT [Mycobacteroides abscessus subsp. bolletii]SKH93541.1 putative lipoprotein LpqT [Mycobacteroides abscessus subsp. bolletii]